MRSSYLAMGLCPLFCSRLVTAGSVSPSNSTLAAQASDLEILYGVNTTPSQTSGSAVVYPLTAQIGLGANQAALSAISLPASWLRFADAFTTTNILNNEIAYISCDSNSNTSNLDASAVVTSVAAQKPRAILLYSLTGPHCVISGDFGYSTILTMTSVHDALSVSTFITANSNAMPSPTAIIIDAAAATTASSSTTTSGPTTAVAMSVLYSITGIITLLFLVIIASGAIRAHRHPERYGPRGAGFPGRPRQSRAKGLARAMLETLPIVKFGDDEPVKPAAMESIELGEGPHAAPEMTGVGASNGEHDTKEKSAATATAPVQEAGIGAATTASVHSKEQESADVLGCSICTEDFARGEDVRVLPCNHKYHPACVDPWLLNVSGTCPLCRIDLRPTTSLGGEASDGELAPPLEDPETTGPERQNMTVLRAVPAGERLAALRALRDERRQQQRDVLAQRGIADPDAADSSEADTRRRHRLTLKLKEKFGIRTSNRRESTIAGPSTATDEGRRGTVMSTNSAIIFGGSTGQDSLAMRMR